MATGSSPSLLDLTVTYDYSTDVNIDTDDNVPRPTIQQLTQLFPFKVGIFIRQITCTSGHLQPLP